MNVSLLLMCGTKLTLFTGVRVEWSKALARRDRWSEEVDLLKEEMRRVLRSLKWEEREWRARAQAPKLQSEAEALSDGRIAYALKQADGLRAVKHSFEVLWLRKEPSRGQAAGPMDIQAQAAAAAIIADLNDDHGDKEDRRKEKLGVAGEAGAKL